MSVLFCFSNIRRRYDVEDELDVLKDAPSVFWNKGKYVIYRKIA